MDQQQLYERVAAVTHLQKSIYSTLDVGQTLDYMRKRYIQPMQEHVDITALNLVDCGAGYGWLAFAFLLHGGRHALLVDVDCGRLEAAREIASILGIANRCEFTCCPMQELSLTEDSAGIFATVETLEHVGEENIDACIELVAQAARRMVILTTPNKFFPIIIHDTKVPLAHWFPPGLRKHYVRLFGKKDEAGNQFVSPLRLGRLRSKFRPVSRVLTFTSYDDWLASYPFQSPYGRGNRWRERPPLSLKLLYRSLSLVFGRHAYAFSPNLCRLWLRK